MKKSSLRAVSALSVLALLSSVAVAAGNDKSDVAKPAKKPVEATMKTGKADIKVSNDEPKSSPTDDGKVTKRAGAYSCDIHIDNRTNYYINRVYVDGNRWGSVSRYGDALARDVAAGTTTLYAELDFTDGSTRYYGPIVFKCDSYATHTWVLR
jgi:hypothetical protein